MENVDINVNFGVKLVMSLFILRKYARFRMREILSCRREPHVECVRTDSDKCANACHRCRSLHVLFNYTFESFMRTISVKLVCLHQNTE